MAAAASRRVAESDLLDAFIESGGGGAGAYLQSRGIVLRSLTSHLFLDGGLVDSGRFSTRALDVLDSGLEFARQKEYRNLGRRHLLYGLLSVKKGAMDLRLREQDRDCELLADLLHATLPPGGAPGQRLELRVSCLTTGMMKILCAAESASLQEGALEVDDRHLLDAWVEDGGGEGGSFLVQNNIRLRRLAESGGKGPA
jgi:ATP-dependent Clp protease ATP-binding subunit ClpA